MKKSKLLIVALCISGLFQVHFIKAPVFDAAGPELDARKERTDDTTTQKSTGFFKGMRNFFKGRLGKTGSDSGDTGTVATDKGEGNGAQQTGILLTRKLDNLDGLTPKAMARLEQNESPISFNGVRPEKTEMTLDQKKEKVDESNFSLTQKAIVKSFVGRTNNVGLLITAMQGLEQEIVGTMAG